jgi:hypothetical protein
MDETQDEHENSVGGEFQRGSYIPFKTPLSLIVCGSTFSGKTHFIHRLLEEREKMFSPPPVEILFCYGAWQSIYDKIESTVKNVRFFNGIPSKQEIETFTEDMKPRLMILDDLMTRMADSPHLTEVFSVYTHHRNLSTILVLQNIFYQGARNSLRDISLNVQGLILFKNMRSPQQIAVLGSQIFPGPKRKFFTEAYDMACSRPWGHLLVNLNPKDSQNYQLMTDILPDTYTRVFLPIT